MRAIRRGDKVCIEIYADEILEWLDREAVKEAVESVLEAGEAYHCWVIDLAKPSGATVWLDLDIVAPPGESDREVYRRESGVRLV